MHERLLGDQFEVKWVAGKTHLIADELSRYPVGNKVDKQVSIAASLAVVPSDLKTIAQVAHKFAECQALRSAVSNMDKSDVKRQGGPLASACIQVWDQLYVTWVMSTPLVMMDVNRIVPPKNCANKYFAASMGKATVEW